MLRGILFFAISSLTHVTGFAQTLDIASLKKQAKEGDAQAQYELADDYLEGKGIPINAKQGVEWLEKAAKLDHAGAQFVLGYMYLKGGGQNIPKDPKQGLEWLRKSADHGNAKADYALALLYRDGDDETGIARNPHEAAKLFRAAARQPDSTKSQSALQEMLDRRLISKQEANWRSLEPTKVAEKGKPFTLAEIEAGLKGAITPVRMAALVHIYKVDFKLSAATRQRLKNEGADDNLLQIISDSQRSS
jgi:hypothetical protein